MYKATILIISFFLLVCSACHSKTKDELLSEGVKLPDKNPNGAIVLLSNALAHNILGSAYLAKGMSDEAMTEFNKTIDLDTNFINAHLQKDLFIL